MRKVYVTFQVKMIINANDDVEIADVIDDMDYNFSSNSDGADIMDTEIADFEVTDSK